MKRLIAAITFMSLSLAATAQADNDTGLERLLMMSMDELMSLKVKISTNTEQTLARAPSVVSVITADDIRATGATNLTEILQSVPGIHVRNNLFGFRPQITFRGASGTHTLLMLNGAPLKDLVWNAGIFWKGLPVSMIDRVEIIRGPGSALFGSDASAGVINVITRAAGRIEQSVAGARLGGFDSQAGWVRHGAKWNGFDIALTAELSHTDGHDPFIAVDGQTARDRAYGTSVSHAPGRAHYGWDGQDLHLSVSRGNWRLLADHLGHDNVEIGLTGAAVLDPTTRGRARRYDLALLYNDEQFASDWGLNAQLRHHRLSYSSGEGFMERPPGYTDATGTYPDGYINRMSSSEQGHSIEVSGLYGGIGGHAIRVGGGYKVDRLSRVEQWLNFGTGADGNPIVAGTALQDVSDTPYAFAPEKTRQNGYVFLQDVWSLADDLELTAGARYDHYSDFGGTLNPRLAMVWQNTNTLTSKLIYGEAFRAPSYLELYAPTAATKPNPNLVPERSKTWELSFAYAATRNLKLDIGFYRFVQSDLIAADASNQFQNTGRNTAHGIEMEAQWQATKTLRLAGNLSHRKETIAFNSVPARKAYLRADWAFDPNWNWNLQANWIGARPLPAGDPRAPLNSHTLVDTTLRHFHRANWEFATSIRNLFDVDAREYSSAAIPDNLPLPGRSLYAELTYRF